MQTKDISTSQGMQLAVSKSFAEVLTQKYSSNSLVKENRDLISAYLSGKPERNKQTGEFTAPKDMVALLPEMKRFLEKLQNEYPEIFTKEFSKEVVEKTDNTLKEAGISSKEERANLIFEALKDLGLTLILSQLGKGASDQASIINALTQMMQQNEMQNRYSDSQRDQEKLVAELSDGKEGPKTDSDYEPKEEGPKKK
ncbi:Uncharacterised protein [Candidatus Anstonella stagnisolia]|nr:Uncharacterised protein [Candidatus Anstonella stagnisolia]